MASSINKSTTTITAFSFDFIEFSNRQHRTNERTRTQTPKTFPSCCFFFFLFPKVNKPLSSRNHLWGKFSNPLAPRYAAVAFHVEWNKREKKNVSLQSCAHNICYSRQVWLIKHFCRYRHTHTHTIAYRVMHINRTMFMWRCSHRQ